MNLTAKQLHDLTAPLFARHPSAKPECLQFSLDGNWENWSSELIMDDHAALIVQGHLVEWLAEKGESPECMKWDDGEWSVFVNGESQTGATLLEALVAAAMEVPQ